jgi:type VI secretion system protein ImpK
LAEPLYWASADLLTLASQIGLGGAPSNAQDMRQVLSAQFETMDQRARAAGVTPEDIRDAQYPLMALFDEVLVQTAWGGQAEWRMKPLQLMYFHENAAGETFFERVDALLRQPHRAHVLSIYFFCLALGFQGRYAMGGAGQLSTIYETVGTVCGQIVPPSEVVAPNAERPDAGRNFFVRQRPIVRVSIACFGIALLLFLILKAVLSSQASRAERTMDDYARSAGTGAP